MKTQVITTVDEVLGRVAELEPMIRAASAEAETERRLSAHVADALRDAGCYHLFRPRSRGGLELDPVSAFRVIEELSRIDSAAGWNVAIANASEPFGLWLSDETTAKVFGSSRNVLAGGVFPPRRAVPVQGGYRLSGRCPFNSNCHAATWILGLAHIYDDGVERLDENGQPITLLTLFPTEKAEIIDNWDTLGMRGTGSHDVNVDDVFVPAERAVPLKPLEQPSPAYSGPWHRLTMWPSVACGAIPALGIAQAGEREIVSAEAEVVRRIFRDSSAGVSPKAIAKRLNVERCPGPNGAPWNPWLRKAPTVAVTMDVTNVKTLELQQEVLELRRRVKKLKALLWLALALLRCSAFTLTHERLPDGRNKTQILRAVDRARDYLPLRPLLGNGNAVPADLTARAAGARETRIEANRSATCGRCPSIDAAA